MPGAAQSLPILRLAVSKQTSQIGLRPQLGIPNAVARIARVEAIDGMQFSGMLHKRVLGFFFIQIDIDGAIVCGDLAYQLVQRARALRHQPGYRRKKEGCIADIASRQKDHRCAARTSQLCSALHALL